VASEIDVSPQAFPAEPLLTQDEDEEECCCSDLSAGWSGKAVVDVPAYASYVAVAAVD
jgi:hypothetical protein